ncbi:MAG: glutamate synthase subunit beta [Lachnospiraceae bacterium]|nr:glutamate synthase subunit beta [Lachnospiraceae bacterium]
MGKATGFLEYERVDATAIPPKKRIKDFREFHVSLTLEEQKRQGARCMECGVPFCQYGEAIRGMTSGCPLHNLIPEWNDLVFRGNFEQAYIRLKKTSNFPEFTSRVCPALCEKACTCGLNGDAVSTKENEKAIIEYAYEHGFAGPKPPQVRTEKRVAVIGSGPSGLAVADQLNQRGHDVTVYERNDAIGGLLRYGIPNMKLEKHIIDRKVAVMEAEGVHFVVNANVGKTTDMKKLQKDYDAIVLCCGASNPRNIEAPGREGADIYYAVDFLAATTKRLVDGALPEEAFADKDFANARGKDVIIIGGGDTGNDCVGTCVRHGAKSVTQLEMMPEPPVERLESNPWPQWPLVKKTDYGQEESAAVFGQDPRLYTTTVSEFIRDKKGNLKKVVLVSLKSETDKKTGRRMMIPDESTKREVPCQLVLIAAGFLGSESYVTKAFGVDVNERTNVKTGDADHKTNVAGIFTAGDMHTGQSLVVKAIAEGRACAAEVDAYLMGYTNL